MGIDGKLKLGGGIIRVVTNHGIKKYYGEYMTLEECLVIARAINPGPLETVMVMHEEANRGNMYRYGEHGAYWEQIGTLEGFVQKE